MSGFITDSVLQAAAQQIVRLSPTQPASQWFSDAVTRANALAWVDISSVLASRGFSPADMANWSGGVSYQTKQGLYWLSFDVRSNLTPDQFGVWQSYDCREYLNMMFITDINGSPIIPSNQGTGNPVGSGSMAGMADQIFIPRGLFPSSNCGWGNEGPETLGPGLGG